MGSLREHGLAGNDTSADVMTPSERDERLLDYYDRMVEARSISARTRSEWLARRSLLRPQLQSVLGLDPWPERISLEPVVTGTLARDGYRVERVYWRSWPGVHTGGWLYVPEGLSAPAPAVLCPHGHWKDGAMHPVVQSRCIGLARKGFVTLAVDSVHTYRYEVGVTPMTAMTWNNIRALDYLTARPDVDASRMGCTGASGGGQQTMYLMALDDRVRVAVPAVLVSYFHRILMPDRHHCPCNHVPGLLRLTDEPEISALFAPRPLLFLTVTGDWTAKFPDQELLELRRVYHLYGQADRLDHEQFPGPHDYHQGMRERAYAWFLRWLCDVTDPSAAREEELIPEPVETLVALSRLPEGEPRWEAVGAAVARRVMFEAPRLEGRDARKSYQERLRADLAGLLGEPATRTAPEPEVRAVTLRVAVRSGEAGTPAGSATPPAGGPVASRWESLTYRSEREVRVPALFVAPATEAVPSVPRPAALAILLQPGGKAAWMEEEVPGLLMGTLLEAGYSVFLPDVRLRGELGRQWKHNTIVWGRPEAGMAVTDLRAGLDYVLGRPDVDPRQVALMGIEEMGITALLAAGLDERVAATVADAGRTTYQDGGEGLPLVPNILRYADTPQIASLVAPRPLWLYRVPQERAGFSSRRYFDWTARSYQSLGARDAVCLDTDDAAPSAAAYVRWLDQVLRRGRKAR